MTGFKSKKAAALDEDGMYLVHHTAQQDATMQSLKDLKRSVCDELGKAAFAQPAQRPWVDLTDEDWEHIHDMRGTSLDNFSQGAVWAKAKLKERNA